MGGVSTHNISPSSWLMQTAKLFCKSLGKLDFAMWMLLGDILMINLKKALHMMMIILDNLNLVFVMIVDW